MVIKMLLSMSCCRNPVDDKYINLKSAHVMWAFYCLNYCQLLRVIIQQDSLKFTASLRRG